MKYMLSIYQNDAAVAELPSDEQQKLFGAFMAYSQALHTAGVCPSSNRLQPASSATTIRAPGGKLQVLDGPFAESKERFGGYFLLDVPNLDVALDWAKRCPGTQYGSVEVRGIAEM